MKRLNLIILLVLSIISLTLMACNQTDNPPDIPEEIADIATETPAPSPTLPSPSPTVIPPTATPTNTAVPPSPTPLPLPTAQTYIVESNDTLLDIAIQFETTTEAIAAANGIEEEDFLQLGQVLVIPGPGDATLISEETTTEAAITVADTAADIEEADSAVVAAAPPPPPPTPAYSGPPLPDISHPANINPLTGLPVDDPATLQRRPLMVRIGNDVGARQSQVGLNQADVVYEEITEWWVTRFSAIFLTNTPAAIGPVRSARLISVQLAPQYQAALAHSGGSDPVRWEISQAPITNLDEFYNPSPYFYRPNQGWQTRLAIDAGATRDYMASKGLDAAVTQQGFIFSDAPDSDEPGADIYIPYPQATSFTEWHYDSASGKYLRWINGAALIDDSDGQQISAANVIVYFADHQATDIVEDSNGATSIRVIMNGVGPAWLFRDGLLTRGSWLADGQRTPYFTKDDGSAYALKPGNTWVEVVPTYYTIGLDSADEASSR